MNFIVAEVQVYGIFNAIARGMSRKKSVDVPAESFAEGSVSRHEEKISIQAKFRNHGRIFRYVISRRHWHRP
jgi:hypothetical protein